MQESIAAIATPAGTGGVAIIRISGEQSLEIARKMFKREGSFQPNRMYAGTICGEGFSDYGFMVYFKAPHTFTGEDVVEFHCHGGVQIARGILKRALALGARAAERGEFTRRAFLNGKLSLASAEGMIDMINAESGALLRAGEMLYSGKLTQKVIELQQTLTDIIAAIAAEIDYPEEDLDGLDLNKIFNNLQALAQEIRALKDSWACGKTVKNGVTVAICGSPNVGKSSLLNVILGCDKAIVSPEAGTTRDAVEGRIEIDGILFNLIDTAGIRQGAGSVESMGIARAKEIIRTADVVLFVTDSEGEIPPDEFSGKLIKIYNKCDISPPQSQFDVVVSAKTGEGIDRLLFALKNAAIGETLLDKAYIVEERHYNALCRALEAIQSVLSNENLTADLIAIDLKEAWDALGEITGETANEEIINTVFSKFCVGK